MKNQSDIILSLGFLIVNFWSKVGGNCMKYHWPIPFFFDHVTTYISVLSEILIISEVLAITPYCPGHDFNISRVLKMMWLNGMNVLMGDCVNMNHLKLNSEFLTLGEVFREGSLVLTPCKNYHFQWKLENKEPSKR